MGNLADLGLGDIFQIVSLSRRSGTLQLTTPSRSGEVVFDNGRVVAVYVTGDRPSVGEYLLARGVIPATTYQEMLAAHVGGAPLAELLTQYGLDATAVDDALEELLKETIYQMFDWDEGTFSFVLEERPDPMRSFSLSGTRVALQHGLNPQYLAIEGARLRDERTQEDALESFLARDRRKPTPLGQSDRAAEVKTFAAKLRDGEEPETVVQPEPVDPVAPFLGPGPGHEPAAVEEHHTEMAEPRSEQVATIEPPPALVPPPVRVTPTPAAAVTTPSYRLLVIDDDPQVTKVLHQSFADRFAAVMIANSVRDALPEIEQGLPGLVVACDLIIARSDGGGILGGIEILERVRQRSPDAPVILFTDYENAEAQERARRLGVIGFLVKPRKAQIQSSKDAGAPSPALRQFIDQLNDLLLAFTGAERARVSGGLGAGAPELAAVSPSPAAVSGEVATAVMPEPPAPAEVEAAPAVVTEALAPISTDAESVTNAEPPAASAERQLVATTRALRASADVGMPFDLRREFAGVMDEVELPISEGLPPRRDTGGPVDVLRSMLAELLDPANRETVTLLVLRFASLVFERAMLFLVTRRAFVGLGGFSTEESSDRFVIRVRKVQIPVEEPSLFAQVVKFRAGYRGPLDHLAGNERLMRGVGGSWPTSDAAAIPLVTNERVAAILYGDNPSGRELALTDTLEIFLQQAGLAMERVLLERKLDEARRRDGESRSG